MTAVARQNPCLPHATSPVRSHRRKCTPNNPPQNTGARADTCAAKKEARQLAWGWRSSPHPRREKGAQAPKVPEDETPATQQEVGEEVDTEVEMEVEPSPEGTEE